MSRHELKNKRNDGSGKIWVERSQQETDGPEDGENDEDVIGISGCHRTTTAEKKNEKSQLTTAARDQMCFDRHPELDEIVPCHFAARRALANTLQDLTDTPLLNYSCQKHNYPPH